MVEVPQQRWVGRPWAARAVRVLSYLVPFAASVVAAFLLSSLLPAPRSAPAGIGRWVAIALVSTVVLVATDRLTRRLLPLSTLLKLTLAFPDQAPSRFRVALRTGSTRLLRQRLDEAARGELGDTPNEAAEGRRRRSRPTGRRGSTHRRPPTARRPPRLIRPPGPTPRPRRTGWPA